MGTTEARQLRGEQQQRNETFRRNEDVCQVGFTFTFTFIFTFENACLVKPQNRIPWQTSTIIYRHISATYTYRHSSRNSFKSARNFNPNLSPNTWPPRQCDGHIFRFESASFRKRANWNPWKALTIICRHYSPTYTYRHSSRNSFKSARNFNPNLSPTTWPPRQCDCPIFRFIFRFIFTFESASFRNRANRNPWKTLTIICRHISATYTYRHS